MDFPAQRRERLARLLADEGIDALMISSPINVTYLTGFSGDSTVLLLTRDRLLLVSDSRYTGQLADECPGLPTHIRPPSQKLPEAVAEALNRLDVRSVGFESNAVTVGEFEFLRSLAPGLDWKGGGERVERLRMVKDASELAQIRTAIEVAERAFIVFPRPVATGRHGKRPVRRHRALRAAGRRRVYGFRADRGRRRAGRSAARAANQSHGGVRGVVVGGLGRERPAL